MINRWVKLSTAEALDTSAQIAALTDTDAAQARTTSSAEYLVSEIGRHKAGASLKV